MDTDDAGLLDAYVTTKAADAFRRLVERHAGLVYGVALRQTRDAHLADDVTQAVFVVLADRAAGLRAGTVLPAWLHTTTRHAVANALRARRRREAHERRAAEMTPVVDENHGDADAAAALHPLLDEALGTLSDGDRAAVVLRYFGGHSNDEVGRQLGTTAVAAAKRVSRAIERMRQFFRKRGVTTDGTVLGASLTAAGTSAPDGLVAAACSAATAGGASPSVASIAKGTQQMIRINAIKFTGTCAAAAAVAIAATLAAAQLTGGPGAKPPPAGAAPSQVSGGADTTAPAAAPPLAARLPDGRTVALLGVSRHPSPGQPWWNADGSPAARPYAEARIANSAAGPRHVEVAVQFGGAGADARELHWELVPYTNTSTGGTPTDAAGNLIPSVTTATFEAPPGGRPLRFRMGVPAVEWRPMGTADADGRLAAGHDPAVTSRGVTTIADPRRGNLVVLTLDVSREVTKANRTNCVAVLKDGRRAEPQNARYNVLDNGLDRREFRFAVPRGDVERYEFVVRPITSWVVFENVAGAPGRPTQATVRVEETGVE